jgi:hypothetical protein
MPGFICVGIGHQNSVHAASKQCRCDLAMHRHCAVAKLGGPDRKVVPSIRQKINARFRAMFGRRRAVEHTDRNPLGRRWL